MQDSISLSSAYKPFNHINSLHASQIAIYSASVVDKATTDCNVALQLTAQLPVAAYKRIKSPRNPISRVLGYTPVAAYKRIKSPRNPSKGIYVPSEARPISCSEFGTTPTGCCLPFLFFFT
jgi:hypothetical protein